MTAARRTTLRVLAGLVVFLALVMARVHVESARELHAAETATANAAPYLLRPESPHPTGVVLILTAKPERERAAWVSPYAQPTGGGVALGGTF